MDEGASVKWLSLSQFHNDTAPHRPSMRSDCHKSRRQSDRVVRVFRRRSCGPKPIFR